MAYNIITLPVSIIFIVTGFGQLFYAIKLNKKFPDQHEFHNSFIVFFLWIIAGLMYPFYISTDNASVVSFQALSMFFICVVTPIIIFLILYYQHVFVIKKNPDIETIRGIGIFLKKFDIKNEQKENTRTLSETKDIRTRALKTDLHRKALHLFPAGVILLLWVFAVYIWDGVLNQNEIWGINGEDFGKFLIITAGYSGLLVFAALDFFRLSYIFEKRNFYHLLPDNVLNLLGKAMKGPEIFNFIKPAALVLSFVPVFFFPFGVFISAALIATIGDGAASVFGLRFGKHGLTKSSNKTIVGYIAGFLTSLVVSLVALWLFEPILTTSKIILIALGGATMFSIIDLLNLKIDDNILNPISCALILGFLYCFL
ncbi:MAG: hypothetical protein ACTSUT_03935 [Promethearchaeota archaeon]